MGTPRHLGVGAGCTIEPSKSAAAAAVAGSGDGAGPAAPLASASVGASALNSGLGPSACASACKAASAESPAGGTAGGAADLARQLGVDQSVAAGVLAALLEAGSPPSANALAAATELAAERRAVKSAKQELAELRQTVKVAEDGVRQLTASVEHKPLLYLHPGETHGALSGKQSGQPSSKQLVLLRGPPGSECSVHVNGNKPIGQVGKYQMQLRSPLSLPLEAYLLEPAGLTNLFHVAAAPKT